MRQERTATTKMRDRGKSIHVPHISSYLEFHAVIRKVLGTKQVTAQLVTVIAVKLSRRNWLLVIWEKNCLRYRLIVTRKAALMGCFPIKWDLETTYQRRSQSWDSWNQRRKRWEEHEFDRLGIQPAQERNTRCTHLYKVMLVLGR